MILTADDILRRARTFAAPLIETEEKRLGSRMAAYSRVATCVGVSSSWLRRLMGRDKTLAVRANDYLNIASAYCSLCERIEARVQHERAITAALGGQTDNATNQSPARVGEGIPGQKDRRNGGNT